MTTFLYEMTCGNVWLWFHLIGAGILLKWFRLQTVLIIAILWELFELYTQGYSVYGTASRYFADTLGDLLAVPVMYLLSKWDGKFI